MGEARCSAVPPAATDGRDQRAGDQVSRQTHLYWAKRSACHLGFQVLSQSSRKVLYQHTHRALLFLSTERSTWFTAPHHLVYHPQQTDRAWCIQDGHDLLEQLTEASGRVLVADLGKHRIELCHHEPSMVLKSRKEDIRFTLKVKVNQALIHASAFCDLFIGRSLKPLFSKNGQGGFQNLLTSVNTRHGGFTRHGLILSDHFISYLNK